MRRLTESDARHAVLGGLILGGGGGGHADLGHALADAALAAGEVVLADVDELPQDAVVAVCAGVGAPGAPEGHVSHEDFVTSLRHLDAELVRRGQGPIAAVATNENGAMGTVNGWLQAAGTGLPVLDCPCNGRAHPTALMGSLGLHRDPDYVAIAGYAGGNEAHYTEGVVVGSLTTASQGIRALSVVAGGLVAVARNPVPVGFLAQRGARGGISQAIEVGAAHAAGGVEAVAALLGGSILASGPVTGFGIEQVSGFDVGQLTVGDVTLRFVNEYMSAVQAGEQVAEFPDLLMTFDATTGEPVVSADLSEGRPITVLFAPRASLLLSVTMDMPELMESIDDLATAG